MNPAPEQPRVYRVVVADDTYLIREGLRQALELEADVEVVAYSSDLPSLLQDVEKSKPDVVITDIRMPPTNTDEGIRAASELRETQPDDRRRRHQPLREPALRAAALRARLGRVAPTCSRSTSAIASG